MRLLAFIIIFVAACSLKAETVRVASFNIAMGMRQAGELEQALAAGDDQRLKQVAEILQRVRPDIVLLNEFDHDEDSDLAGLLTTNYLSVPQNGQAAIDYPYRFTAAVNTGVDSGLDLDGDGETGGPADAWGFGHFPGQYGMLVLSRFPIREADVRTFRLFPWKDLPGALKPARTDGKPFYNDETWEALRLSSKSHWDVIIDAGGKDLHFLVHHPTPPVFDGPEDRNGRRNFDEIRFWAEYTRPGGGEFIVDDQGRRGGIADGARFVLAGDFNADPHDGDSRPGAIGQLLEADWIDASCTPHSEGARLATERQGGANVTQRGDPAADTADFNDDRTGNLRLDYVLPSANLDVSGCGVFWPAEGEEGFGLEAASDHRLVWLDIRL